MLPQARRLNPADVGEIDGQASRGWHVTSAAVEAAAFSGENLRHNFHPDEARIEARVSNGTRIAIAWPGSAPDDGAGVVPGTFFVFSPDGGPIIKPRAAARELVPDIAVVPTLTPLDDREAFIGDETLRRNRTSRRSSRYFRNALHRLSEEEWIEFTSFIYERTPELTKLDLRLLRGSGDDDFDLFYEEAESRGEREIGWAGDGVQIWLQALYHLWVNRDSPVVVLDEPDVFLHPDLQRRLARTLFAGGQQTILATHSVEMLAEAEPGSAVWVDRSRRSAERPKGDGALALMGRRLGSGYELGVGKALRSRVALFVEGDDVPVLAQLARVLGLKAVSSSDDYATVPLGGFSRNSVAAAFAETMQALGAQVRTFVVLDGDLRSQEARMAATAELRNAGTKVHLWIRRELENYLLVPSAIAKVSGLPLEDAEELLAEAVEGGKDEARVTLQSSRLDDRRRKGSTTHGHSEKTVLGAANSEFDDLWSRPDGPVSLVDAKAAIRSMNGSLQRRKARTLNVHSLAKAISVADMSNEVREVLNDLDALIRGS